MDYHLTPTPTKEPVRPLSFPNGALKRHNPHRPRSPPPLAAAYRECLKNHAASLGGHALDGCGEFMPSPLATPSDPTSLRCAACGCHRNFHRRHDDHDPVTEDAANGDLTPKRRSSSSASPPQTAPPAIPSSYFPSAPHMLLALSSGLGAGPAQSTATAARKRFRTRFSREQKEKMFVFAEKLGWRMQKQDEALVEEFCTEIGVAKGVLKVWMHNNKHTLGKKEQSLGAGAGSDINNGDDSGIDSHKSNRTHALNGSSSSS